MSFAEQQQGTPPHVGLDVLHPAPNQHLQECYFQGIAAETDSWRPSYVLSCDYSLADVAGHDAINLFVTDSGNSFLHHKSSTTSPVTYPGFLELTLNDATKFWGTPKKHVTKTGEYLIFDAFNNPQFDQEKNLYHIDIRVDENKKVVAYRVRGIGINNADWILPNTQLGGVSDTKRRGSVIEATTFNN